MDFAHYQPSKLLGSNLHVIHLCTTYKFQFLAHFPFLHAKFNIGSIWDRLLAIIRSISANLRRSAKSKIPDRLGFSRHMGAIHSTKISGHFGPKLNGSVRSNRKNFEKTGPPFEVDQFSRSDRLEFWLNGLRL